MFGFTVKRECVVMQVPFRKEAIFSVPLNAMQNIWIIHRFYLATSLGTKFEPETLRMIVSSVPKRKYLTQTYLTPFLKC